MVNAECRMQKGEGRREKGDGRREKGDGRREMGEGRSRLVGPAIEAVKVRARPTKPNQTKSN
jgi:hypothetical protein